MSRIGPFKGLGGEGILFDGEVTLPETLKGLRSRKLGDFVFTSKGSTHKITIDVIQHIHFRSSFGSGSFIHDFAIWNDTCNVTGKMYKIWECPLLTDEFWIFIESLKFTGIERISGNIHYNPKPNFAWNVLFDFGKASLLLYDDKLILTDFEITLTNHGRDNMEKFSVYFNKIIRLVSSLATSPHDFRDILPDTRHIRYSPMFTYVDPPVLVGEPLPFFRSPYDTFLNVISFSGASTSGVSFSCSVRKELVSVSLNRPIEKGQRAVKVVLDEADEKTLKSEVLIYLNKNLYFNLSNFDILRNGFVVAEFRYGLRGSVEFTNRKILHYRDDLKPYPFSLSLVGLDLDKIKLPFFTDSFELKHIDEIEPIFTEKQVKLLQENSQIHSYISTLDRIIDLDLSKVENPVHKDIIARLIESEKKSSLERIDVLDKTLATLRPPVKPPRKVVLGTSTAMAETIASEKAPEPTLSKDFPVNETFGRNRDSLLDSILEITSRSSDTNSIKMKNVVLELVSRGIMDDSDIPVIPEETENPYYYTLFSPEKYYKAITNSRLKETISPEEFSKIQGILRPLSLPYGIGGKRHTQKQRLRMKKTTRTRRHHHKRV